MKPTIVELPTTATTGPIVIRPYVDENADNMGLQKYNISVHDGVYHEEPIACLEQNGVKRYVTGLNEFAPEIKMIADATLRNAKIKEIRKVVSELEKELASNIVDPDDKEFWNKIKLLHPDNSDFWDKVTMRSGNQPTFLDPVKNPFDRIKLYGIEAGGFSTIARSHEDARMKSPTPKFYLDRYEQTATTKTEDKKLKNKAIVKLDEYFNTNTNKLFYIAKILDSGGIQYKKNTPNDIIYDNMDKYINGEGWETNKKRAAQTFLTTAEMDVETLKIRAMIKDAVYMKYIQTRSDGFFYHTVTASSMGRNTTEITEYLKNPANDDILLNITKEIEKYWNR